jgi:hypothetical protein
VRKRREKKKRERKERRKKREKGRKTERKEREREEIKEKKKREKWRGEEKKIFRDFGGISSCQSSRATLHTLFNIVYIEVVTMLE